jgi:hypothetical protein
MAYRRNYSIIATSAILRFKLVIGLIVKANTADYRSGQNPRLKAYL